MSISDGSVIFILENRPRGWAAMEQIMSGHFAAYLAIAATLAFAPAGATSAAQVNIPRPNVPRPQISAPKPSINVPTAVSKHQLGVLTSPPSVSPSGTASANPNSGTSGGSLVGASSPSFTPGSPSYSGGYSTVGKANASPSVRCRSKGGGSNCP
jgi:hypothetical protein